MSGTRRPGLRPGRVDDRSTVEHLREAPGPRPASTPGASARLAQLPARDTRTPRAPAGSHQHDGQHQPVRAWVPAAAAAPAMRAWTDYFVAARRRRRPTGLDWCRWHCPAVACGFALLRRRAAESPRTVEFALFAVALRVRVGSATAGCSTAYGDAVAVALRLGPRLCGCLVRAGAVPVLEAAAPRACAAWAVATAVGRPGHLEHACRRPIAGCGAQSSGPVRGRACHRRFASRAAWGAVRGRRRQDPAQSGQRDVGHQRERDGGSRRATKPGTETARHPLQDGDAPAGLIGEDRGRSHAAFPLEIRSTQDDSGARTHDFGHSEGKSRRPPGKADRRTRRDQSLASCLARSSRAMSMSWSSWPPISLRSPAICEDPGAGDAVALGRVAGVLEEGRVDAGVPHHHRHPVEPALLRHRGAYDVLGGVDDLHEVHAGPPAELVADADERVERACCPHRRRTGVRTRRSGSRPPARPSPCWRSRGRGSRGRGSRPSPREPISATSAETRSPTPSMISAPAESTT